MTWCWQHKNWPHFTWNKDALSKAEHIFAQEQGIMIGLHNYLSKDDMLDMTVSLMCQEALDTSTIEGENLDRESIQSSLKKHLSLKAESHILSKPAEAGISEMMVDLYRTSHDPLTEDMLFRWHNMLMNGRRDIQIIGGYRQHQEPMQIVSGADYARKIHYEAPPSAQISSEMNGFIEWFNHLHKCGDTPLAHSALAHLWFESIHPFEDGNGRIGRALSEKIFSLYQKQAMVTGIATVILRRKKEYYSALEAMNRTLEATEWILLFAAMSIEAQRRTQAVVKFTIEKSKLLNKLHGDVNPRQEKVLLRLFAAGIDGFVGGLSAKNYSVITDASSATVTRDLADLVEKKALIKTGENKGTRYHLNINIQPVAAVSRDEII